MKNITKGALYFNFHIK